ncbi:cold-shock protein [Serinicoccus sp. CNJ-927]|uniref:cold-shock protein n=1 Tax=Serinicoccus sp. CNJ-927 TaxID=1904970 RepID=UPI000A3F3B53|nr:cold shock domain-containing protein [Serinicoccus sp. CNJ-927]
MHVSVLRDVETLDPGDRVRYQVRQSDQGPQADRVELLSSRRRTVCRSSRVCPSRGQARSPCPASASWTTRCEHRFMAA